ncbi:MULTISPECIES: DUF2516 family protein [unclassified Streptomyces]|uniref:DUF2516 family protein n=1 Tax=unclassified Streptomyces TaxID=2593676 RepID=UPI002DD96B1C|nr:MULTISPECIES: DUF2516 family protein [unclassified Streptomyces]WSA93860.1 DUF2516 family protein [Streptomyces sp. NBC_01795]WSB78231.1 DUF2516 family protein [Streptomyces sp. NBC_01775]WSS13514.1 DUF2516 family protein [Streptomyces sp. NBC_01186]WSS42312.1 DUF2516 family protein [Streptomyces sp. NBC_01187]
MLMQGFTTVMGLINLVILALAVFAFVDGAIRREDAYRAADKQNKQFWLIILGIAVVVNLVVPMVLLQIIGLIASIVYIVDVRPALKQVAGGGRGGRRKGGSSSDGPYGPHNGR